MIALTQETLISMTQAAKLCPGGEVHVSTLHRWRLRGVRGVRLETILTGGRRRTSVEALDRFFAKATAVADGGSSHESFLTRARKQATRKANDFLDSQGI